MSDPAHTPRQRVADHARRLSPLSWKVLAIFVVIGSIGAGLYAYTTLLAPATPAAATAPPPGASGFLGGSAPAAEPAAPSLSDTWTAWSGQHGAAVGFGFAGGFVIAFVFRAFIKLMTLITLLIVGGMAALSYYGIVNVDLTAASRAVQSNADWLTEQATRIKDVLIAHLPSSGAGAAGAYFGLRRR